MACGCFGGFLGGLPLQPNRSGSVGAVYRSLRVWHINLTFIFTFTHESIATYADSMHVS